MRDLIEFAAGWGREVAEGRMLDTCTIRRVTGDFLDESTMVRTPTYVQVYAGPCRVVDVEAVVRTPEAGGATVTVHRVRLDIPVTATGVRRNDQVEITGSVTRPAVAGMAARVVSLPADTQTTAQRISVEEG